MPIYNEGVILALLSDVHANLEALEAVLEDAESHGAERYLCLGDMIGFNGDPEACLELLQPRLQAAVQGNHEAALLNRSVFGERIYRCMMDATERRLQPKHKEWLHQLPLLATCHGIMLAHACYDSPARWGRLTTADQAALSFQATSPYPLAFFGHSHHPTIFTCRHGESKLFDIPYGTNGSFSLQLQGDTRYLVNPGSVGQPRDGDWRAAYALYDQDERRLTLRRVNYDVQRAAKKIQRMGLPSSFSKALLEGKDPTR